MELDGQKIKELVNTALENRDLRRRLQDVDLAVEALVMCVEMRDDNEGLATVTPELRVNIKQMLQRDPTASTLLREFERLTDDQGCLLVMVLQPGKDPVAAVMSLSKYTLAPGGHA